MLQARAQRRSLLIPLTGQEFEHRRRSQCEIFRIQSAIEAVLGLAFLHHHTGFQTHAG